MLKLQVVGNRRWPCTERHRASMCAGQTLKGCLCALAQELLAERGGAKTAKPTSSSEELELQSRGSSGV